MALGLIGLGKMGMSLALRLKSQGIHDLVVWDRDALAQDRARANSLQLLNDASEVCQASEMVMTVINDDAGIHQLYLGEKGLLTIDIKDKLFIEMSTIQPQTVRDLGQRVLAMGGHLIGAPMMGTVSSALNGSLFLPIGGEPSDLIRAKPYLDLIASETRLIGPLGTGHVVKLISNLTMAAYIQSLAEGLALASQEGLELKAVLDVLALSPSANAWLKFRGFELTHPSDEVTLDIASLRKDMLNAMTAGVSKGVPMDLTSSLVTTLSGAVACGHGKRDIAHMPSILREQWVQKPA